jgi:hypothetical protein
MVSVKNFRLTTLGAARNIRGASDWTSTIRGTACGSRCESFVAWNLEQSKSAVLNSLTSPSSQRTYDHAIREFIEWCCSGPRLAFNKTVVTRCRISLEQQRYASRNNLRRATVRRLAYKAADCGLLSADLAAGIRRVTETQTASSEMGRLVTFGRELGSSSLGAFTRHNPAQTKTETAAVSESPKNGAMSCGFGCAPSLQRPFSVEERREMDSM